MPLGLHIRGALQDEAVHAVKQIARKLEHLLGGSERLSRWEIGELLLPWYVELRGRLAKGSARNHAGAPRPKDLSLTCHKIQKVLSFRIPGLRSWLAERTHQGDDLWDFEAS